MGTKQPLGPRSNVDGLLPVLQQEGLLDGARSLLTIGGGAGALEVELAKSHGIRVSYVEPNLEQANVFRDNARRAGIERLVDDVHLGPIQTFKPKARLDLILSLHSWFAVGPDPAAARVIASWLTPNGHLFAVMSSETSGLSRALQVKRTFAEAISRSWNAGGLRHRLFQTEYHIPIDLLLVDGRLTDIARNWCAYKAKSSWDRLSSERQQAIFDYINSFKDAGLFTDHLGCLVIAARDAA